MSTNILTFKTLSDLTTYLKMVQPSEYIVNTLQNTLTARLNDNEIAVAVENYGATARQKESPGQKAIVASSEGRVRMLSAMHS